MAERLKFLFCWQDMLLPRVKYARIMSFRPFRSSEWRPEGPPKHENSQLFAKKVSKLDFSDGGQTAPSQAAPRAGGAGDVLTGLLPPHSNKISQTTAKKIMWCHPRQEHAKKTLYGVTPSGCWRKKIRWCNCQRGRAKKNYMV